MNVNLSDVLVREQDFLMDVQIPESFFKKTGILRMDPVHFEGNIKMDNNQDYYLSFKLNGNMFLEDARTLEEVIYPFSCDFREKIAEDSEFCGRFLKNNQNTLDILSILWENIVLEIPISYTLSEEDLSSVSGEDIIDNNQEVDPRLAPLLGLLNDEKE